jgi:hypothetical protein
VARYRDGMPGRKGRIAAAILVRRPAAILALRTARELRDGVNRVFTRVV